MSLQIPKRWCLGCRFMSRIAYRIFLLVLILSPLFFGAVEAWSLAIMEIMSVAAALVFLSGRVSRRRIFEMPALMPLILLWSFMAFQLIPLPPGVLRMVSPAAFRVYTETIWVLTPGQWMPVALNIKAGVLELFRYSSYAFIYMLTVQILSDKGRLKDTVVLMVVFASLLAFSSILQFSVAGDKALWVRELTGGGAPFGPYVNRNHYAGFMVPILSVAAAMFLYHRPRVRFTSLRERLVEILRSQRANEHVLYGFGAMLMGVSVILTQSRGGIISLCVSMAFMFYMLRRRQSGRAFLLVLFLGLLIPAVEWFGWMPILERFEILLSPEKGLANYRVEMWEGALGIIRDFPVLGAGQGAFMDIYKSYGVFPRGLIVDHAHNDYLEIMAEGGAVGFLLFVWFVFSVLSNCVRALKRRQEKYSVYLAIGVMAGLVGKLVHGLLDFNHYIGANGLYLYFLSGLAVAMANTRLRKGKASSLLPSLQGFPQRRAVYASALVLAIIVLINLGMLQAYRRSVGLEDYARGLGDHKRELEETLASIEKIKRLTPLEAAYRQAHGRVLQALDRPAEAVASYAQALRLRPLSGAILQDAAMAVSESGHQDKAEQLFRSSIKYDPRNPERLRQYAAWLYVRDRQDEALAHLRDAIGLEPKNTSDYITIMALMDMDEIAIMDNLPEMVHPHIIFAKYLLDSGKEDLAEIVYQRALELAPGDEKLRPWHLIRIFNFYFDGERYTEALAVVRKAMDIMPRDARLKVKAGMVYERLGIGFRAVEYYQYALILDPGNRFASQRLRVLKEQGK